MNALIVDASVALSWCFEDEETPETELILDHVRLHGAIVPGIWHLELANALLQAERRHRISQKDISVRLEVLGDLPITTDRETGDRAWRETISLARAEGLTPYDAAYLELAIRHNGTLATKDRDLAAAARRIGLSVLP